ncbi:MAG TPA: SDR family oxidoreductase [Sphingomonadaceae bacterium]|nr:SDR family oxidoreductase [Sphingomonadaceae bacterium]
MGSLDGEIALVTGAGRGFGRAIATRLAAEGAAVAIMARNKAEIDEVAAGIEADGGKAIAIVGDVTDAADVDRAVTAVERRFGPLSLFVNNAGLGGPYGPMWEVDVERWWAAQAVHIRAPMLFLRRILPGMVERDKGRIIIVSAVASRLVAPHLSAYCTGKIAQTRIVAEAAAELKDKAVKIFAIDPGFVFTDLARETMMAPEARQWLPDMVGRLETMADKPDNDADLGRCAQRCVDLFSGRFDALSGRYMELPDDLDAMVREAEQEKAA